MKRIFLTVLLTALPALCEVSVYRNFTLIDGAGNRPRAMSAMIVDNGRITWVGPAAGLKIPALRQVCDARHH
jgi:hypothetical protein